MYSAVRRDDASVPLLPFGCRNGSWGVTAAGYMDERKLRFLQSADTLNRVKLEFFRRLSTDALKAWLAPGQPGCLQVRHAGWPYD